MTQPFLGEIKLASYNFAPKGYAQCNGQLMSIQQNTALFSLLGTIYGGNGTTTFSLPDLQGRAVQHMGNDTIGTRTGTETVTLTTQQLPAHNHLMRASTTAGALGLPTNNFLGAVTPTANTTGKIYAAPGTGQALNAGAIGPDGGNQPHENMQPFLVLNYNIALVGVFPSRN
jgi:microcystin-dependent protein